MILSLILAAISVTPAYTNVNRAGGSKIMTNIEQWAPAVEAAIGQGGGSDPNAITNIYTNGVSIVSTNRTADIYAPVCNIATNVAEAISSAKYLPLTGGWMHGTIKNYQTNAPSVLYDIKTSGDIYAGYREGDSHPNLARVHAWELKLGPEYNSATRKWDECYIDPHGAITVIGDRTIVQKKREHVFTLPISTNEIFEIVELARASDVKDSYTKTESDELYLSLANDETTNRTAVTIGNRDPLAKVGRFSIVYGKTNSAESDYSLACGFNTRAKANHAIACGAKSISSNTYAYTWSGVRQGSRSYYGSHGTGTFNLNPVDGLSGFWIGETNMANHIKNVSEEMVTEKVDYTTNNTQLVSTITNLAPSKARGISLSDPVRQCNWYQAVTNGVFYWMVEE